jgi:hypothetical protein
MKTVNAASAPKGVRKISKGAAKRKRRNGSLAAKKSLAKTKRISRKVAYGRRNRINANWVYQAPVLANGFKGAVISIILILSVFFTNRGTAKSPPVASQTDGKKPTTRIRKKKVDSYFMLGVLPNTNMVITAIMKMPRSYKKRGDRARAIINACTLNLLIVVPPITIAAYLALLDAFVVAQTNMATGTRGLRPIRDNAWKAVEVALNALMAVAQAAGNASPTTAIAIIESGSFYVKTVRTKKDTIFSVSNSNTSGTLSMGAAGASIISLHIWEQSVDGIKWNELGTTHKAKASYPGFVPVSKVWVRHRTDTNGIFTVWEYFYITVS